ncbi:MAG: NADH-quinone oxidoreductase subunit L [Coriobacteriia bacterium]|nr:NADH-quinone oxidoreductase subunit L [Coriobacteriia bacterium]
MGLKGIVLEVANIATAIACLPGSYSFDGMIFTNALAPVTSWVPQLNLWWVALAPLFPFFGFALLICLPRELRKTLRYVPIACLTMSFFIAVAAAIAIWPGGPVNEAFYTLQWTLGHIGAIPLTLSLAVDSLAVIMLLMVSIVGLCVQIYSLHYMKDDERIGWFYCIMSLFLAAMLGFVLSGNILLQFALWEIMGVCSYFLIGFWYRNKAPRQASQKAFLVTRAGDVGFFIALSAIFVAAQSFELSQIFATAASWSPFLLAVVCLGLIWAAIGKSAQFPMSIWLPDAMAGPTSGSALIHAATMVVAGVFLLLRMLPVLTLYPLAMNIILAVGVITALYGGLLACFQKELKRVLAFSTISQLGFLFAALGVGAGFVAAFHTITHAFFKALLFLAAGAIIAATGTKYMQEMGGLAKRMPVTFASFSIGAFALAGVVPLSGFFSKDEIFKALLHHGHDTGNYLAFAGIAIAGALTAFYVFKSWFTIFFGKPQTEGSANARDASTLETVPIAVLAVLAAVTGLAVIPLGVFLGYPAGWPPLYMVAISTGVMVFGASMGFLAYAYRTQLKTTFARPSYATASAAIAADTYLNALYQHVIIRPYFWLSYALWRLDVQILDSAVDGVTWLYQQFARLSYIFDVRVIDGAVNGISWIYVAKTRAAKWFDDHIIDGIVNGASWSFVLSSRLARIFDVRVIDGFVNGLGQLSVIIGGRLRTVQSGEVQWYQRLMLGAGIVLLAAFVIVFVLRGL